MSERQRIIESRRLVFFKRMMLIIMCLSLPFLIADLFAAREIFPVLTAFFLILAVLYMLAGKVHAPGLFRAMCLLLAGIILFLLYISSHDPRSYLFTPIVPLVFYLMLGKREGMIWSFLFLASLVLLNMAAYPAGAGGQWMNENMLLLSSVTAVYLMVIAAANQIETTFQRVYESLQEANTTLEEKNAALMQAQEEINTLKSVVPMCSRCKKVHDEDGSYVEIDVYISRHTDSDISHGLCPECTKELYPELAEEILKKA